MKKLLSLMLSAVLLFGVMTAAVWVSAASPDAFGDLDANYSVTAGDALIALQGAVKKINLSDAQKYYADVDFDESVSATDALYILQYAVGKLEKIPFSDFIEYEDLLIDKVSSQLDNGAYSRDVSADTSFRITTENLEENTIYVISSTSYSMKNANVTKDAARFMFSLQGLINRDFGITHTSLIFHKSDDTERFWYNYITDEGQQFEGYNVVNITSFKAFVTTFAVQIEECGIVLWDPNVPATANVAATICGLDGYLPVKYDTAERSLYTTLMEYVDDGILLDDLERQSLVDLFGDAKLGTKIVDTDINSTGSSKCDAYLWACEKYMSRCSTRYMAYIVDGAVSVDGNPMSAYGDAATAYTTCLYNHDYYIARRCFFFDLTVFPGEAPCDDPNQPLGADSDTFRALLDARYKRANGEFGQMLGFPPWWLKYTQHNNLASIFEVYLEWMTVEFNTLYNMSKEADAAHPCALANCSVYYKYISTTEEFVNNEPAEEIEYDSDTYYYMFYLGDYDSSAWLANHTANFWDDEKRGELPSAWAFNPNLSERVPMVFDYVYSTATENDYFTAGDSGAGYVFPSALTQGHVINTRCDFKVTRTNPTATEKFAAYTRPYYDVFDMDITGFIINVGYAMNEDVLNMYNDISPVGSLFSSSNEQLAFVYNGTPYINLFNCIGFDDTQDLQAAIQTLNNMRNDMKGVKFSAYRTICKSPTQMYNLITTLEDRAELKDVKIQLCDPYNFFRLAKESGAVPEWNGK